MNKTVERSGEDGAAEGDVWVRRQARYLRGLHLGRREWRSARGTADKTGMMFKSPPGTVGRPVTVIHGINEREFHDLIGETVGNVKRRLSEWFNIPYWAEAFLNGMPATVDAVLSRGDTLEFCQRFGFKSGGDNPLESQLRVCPIWGRMFT